MSLPGLGPLSLLSQAVSSLKPSLGVGRSAPHQLWHQYVARHLLHLLFSLIHLSFKLIGPLLFKQKLLNSEANLFR